MNNISIDIITYFCDFLLLAVAVVGVIRYKYLTPAFKILGIAALASLTLNILENIFIVVYRTNAPIDHIRAVVEYAFYALVYYNLFTDRRLKRATILSIIVITPLAVINALFLQPFLTKFPTYINLPALGLLVIFSLSLFRQMLLYPLKTPLLKQGVFWFNTGIIFYSTTMFLNIGLSNAYTGDPALDVLVFYLWYFIVYIFAILIGIALLTDNKETYKTNAL